MIQDIFPEQMDNAYRNISPAPDSRVMHFRQGRILAAYDETAELIRFPAFQDFEPSPECTYLFSVSGTSYFLALTEDGAPADGERYSMQELRGLRLRSNTDIFAAYTAYHLWNWYRTSRYCGVCSTKTETDDKERAKVCPRCGNRIYPRINPAVIVGVINGEKLLITRYRNGFRHNALVAGFTEIGETAEETVIREIREETGLKVRNIRYYKSQPWGIASDLLMGFYCEVDGDETIHMDTGELRYAEWVPRKEIELQPSDYSLTNEMMRMFREGKQEKLQRDEAEREETR